MLYMGETSSGENTDLDVFTGVYARLLYIMAGQSTTVGPRAKAWDPVTVP